MITMIFGRNVNNNKEFVEKIKKTDSIIIEYPECFKHPVEQLKLMDKLLSKKDLIIITHSEHMLSRLQTRIAEGKVRKQNVKLYNVVGKKGIELILLDSGCIKNYPKDFFGNMLEESCNRVLGYRNSKNWKRKCHQ